MNDDSADVFTEPCRYGPVGKSKKFRASGSFCYYLRSLIINVVGNCIGVFGLHAGVAGVAWPSLISRTFSAVVITVFCFSSKNPVRYLKEWIFRLDGRLQKTILRIAVPTGVESGIFQLVKVALFSVVALFGTYQIAANGVAQSIWTMASLVCVTMWPVFITVIGQYMGAGDIAQAELYFKKLTKITLVFAIIWNGLVFAVTPLFMSFYTLEAETKHLTILLVLIHNIFNAIAFPFADPLGKGLRATGDVAFTTAISLFTTIGVRLIFSMETFLRLWNALNSLPEIQGRRIDAHIILGKSVKEIAEAEGVHEESIRQSIKRGLERMKKLFDFFILTHLELMKKCLGL